MASHRTSLHLVFAAFSIALVAPLRAQDVQGLVQPIKSISVASPVLQEVVEAVLVEEGNTVEQGQVLIQLRCEREKLAVQEGERLVENAEFVAKGFEALVKDKMGSREQMLKSQTELALAKIKLQASHVQLDEKTIKAPIAGIVVKKYKEPGESVDRVEKLIDLVNIDKVFLQSYLDPKLLATLEVGQGIDVRFPAPLNQSFTGRIDFIDPRIDASSGLFRIKVLIDNPEHKIKAGMRGVADFAKVTKR